MKEGQDKIYYAAGSSIAKIGSLPQVEQVRDKDYDIFIGDDNAEQLFKYITTIDKEMAKNSYFVIDKKSKDISRLKVRADGQV